jgi:prophage antirepressor-like protein
MNQLINLSGDYVTFDIGEKNKQNVKIVGTFKQPYFCGRDICEILGYENIQQALYLHVKQKHKKELKALKEEVQLISNCTSFGSNHLENLSYNDGKAVYVNEPGLYSLIMKSKAQFAEAFQDLVYEVILPSIRQHGTYTLEKEFEEKLAISKHEKEQEIKARQKAENEKEEALKLRRIAEFRALTLNKLCVNYSERVKTQVFYIVTSKAFSKDNEFKIGGADSVSQLKKRLSVYNSGNSGVHPELQMYFVFLIEVANYKQMESRMKELLVPFRSKRNANTENFNIHFDILKPLTELVADHYNEEIEKLNEFLKMLLETHTEQYMSSGELPEIDPELMPSHLNVEVAVTKRKFGEVKGKKIKISDLNQDELKQVIEQVLETKWGGTGKGTPVRRSELEQILEATFIIASHKRRVWDVAKVSIEEAGKTPRY